MKMKEQFEKAKREGGMYNLNHGYIRLEYVPRGKSWRLVKCGRKVYGLAIERTSSTYHIEVFNPDNLAPAASANAYIMLKEDLYLGYSVKGIKISRGFVENAAALYAAIKTFREIGKKAGINLAAYDVK